MTSSRRKKTKAQRLAELGISEREFEQYKQMFCDTRLRPKFIKMTGRGWITCPYQCDDRLILTHLTLEETIGLFPANQIDYLMFDIDNHDPGSIPSVEDRARDIMRVFDCDPLIYTSSDSGGLRICYFLQRKYHKKTVHEFARRSLAEAGLQIGSGFIEIMATDKGDRLPFGEGSYVVDPHTLEPLYDVLLPGMIDHAWRIYTGNRLHIEHCPVNPSKHVRPERAFNDIVADLIENGLPPDMTTNDALLCLNREFMGRRGFSREKASGNLKSWIRSNHNNNSRSVNSGKINKVYAQIDRIVRGFNPEKCQFKPHKVRKPRKLLAIGDVERIVKIFPDYRTQLAAFSLLEYVKSSGVLLECIDSVDTIGRIELNNSNYTILGFLQVWECEIPYKLFLHLDGFDRTHPAKTRKVLEDYGLLRLHRREDHSKHKCRAYLVYFTFNSESEEVVSMKEALVRLKTPKELRAEYGQYRSTKLIRG